jgi:hypothetical protein
MKEARIMVNRGVSERSRDGSRRLSNVLVVIAMGMILGAPLVFGQNTNKQDDKQDKASSGKSVGFILSDDATAKDVGLPIYPGAERRKDASDDSSSLQMGLWGGSSGFKLVVLKLVSDDSPEKIAAFYRKALARYGQVLDCGKSAAKAEKSDAGHNNQIECDDDHAAGGSFALKAGTKQSQHVVGVEPSGHHTNISLVYVWTPKSKNKED